MRHLIFAGLVGLGFLLNPPATAQTTLDALQNDLNAFSQQRQQANDQALNNFLNPINTAAQSKEAALQLYQLATGKITSPDPNAPPPVNNGTDYAAVENAADGTTPKPHHHHHTDDASNNPPTVEERQAATEQKEAEAQAFASMVQAHCGMLHFAALFTCKPNTAGLQKQFIAWLTTIAPTYAQLGHSMLGHVKMQESPFTTYLGFQQWNNSDQSQWSIRSLPQLYREQVIEPLRTAHNAQVLTDWDTYIAMRQNDQQDQNQWANEIYPKLMFERGCDDFNLAPSTAKLANLIAILKSVPNHPQFADMMGRLKQMISDFRASQAPPPAPASTTDTSAPPAPAPAPSPQQ